MILLAYLVLFCGLALLGLAVERVMKHDSRTGRLTRALLGEPGIPDDADLAPVLPISHVRQHCGFCGNYGLHHPGCSRLDRLDAPRPHRETAR